MRSVANTIIAVLLFFLPYRLSANDGVAEIGLGGVISYGKNNDISMESELLEIGTDQINIEYVFHNHSDDSITIPVAFPLPRYAVHPAYRDRAQPGRFRVIVDGHELPFLTTVRAVCFACRNEKDGTDITAAIRAVGLTDEQMALLPGSFPNQADYLFNNSRGRVSAVNEDQIKALDALGYLWDFDESELDNPAWYVAVTYVWNMKFPPKSDVTVSHQYVPFLGLGSSSSRYGPYVSQDEWKEVCATPAMIKRFSSERFDFRSINAATVRYILTTANTWKTPIKHFTMRLKKSHPDEVISLCFPGDFIKKDPLTLEVVLRDFVPKQEIYIQYWDPTRRKDYFGTEGEPPIFNSGSTDTP